jgi:DNA-binding NarL/FixJ family response regulator
LVHFLSANSDFEVIEAVGDEPSARASLALNKPDLVLLDLMLGEVNGLTLITDLIRGDPTLKILVLSMMKEAVYAERALKAGAVGYVMKSADTTEVLQAIRSVLEGRVYLSPRIYISVFPGTVQRASSSKIEGVDSLSNREFQVFQMIGSGIPNRQMALQLGISVKTIETHREHLKNKLRLHDSVELVHAAELFVNSLNS